MSVQSKIHRTNDLIKRDHHEILYAAERQALARNDHALAEILAKAREKNGSSEEMFAKLDSDEPIPFTKEEALDLLLYADIGQNSYNAFKLSLEAHNINCLPQYEKLLECKK